MEKVIKDSILNIIDKIIESVQKRDVLSLDKLSNYTIHNSSIYQDEYSLSLAIITYSLGKMLSREKEIIPEDDESIINTFVINLSKMKEALIKDNDSQYKNKMGNIFRSIKKLDKRVNEYVDEVITKSKIKKGTVMYQHGISISRVAEAMNISEWELMGYVGNINNIDFEKDKVVDVMDRINYTKKIFGM